ncbi:hypothetical protein DIPPA_12086 [Diplonema papillatum]|nr:hypothetical protein DIPPA_12086 [Diplonema papillatum]|eukprot:gene6407-9805_t
MACRASRVRLSAQGATSNTTLARLIQCSRADDVLRVIGRSIQCEVELVAALNQCPVVEEPKATQGKLVDEVMLRVSPVLMPMLSDCVFKALLKALVQCGKPDKAAKAYKCIAMKDASDVGAAIMAAAATGDAKWAADLWEQGAAMGIVALPDDAGPAAAAPELEVFARHYLAAMLRSGEFSDAEEFRVLVGHCRRTLRVDFTESTLTTLLHAAPSPAAVLLVWRTFGAFVQPTAGQYSACLWGFLTLGSPRRALKVYRDGLASGARRELSALLPFHCGAAEAHLAALFAAQRRGEPPAASDVAGCRDAAQRARLAGATDDWLETVDSALGNVEACDRLPKAGAS